MFRSLSLLRMRLLRRMLRGSWTLLWSRLGPLWGGLSVLRRSGTLLLGTLWSGSLPSRRRLCVLLRSLAFRSRLLPFGVLDRGRLRLALRSWLLPSRFRLIPCRRSRRRLVCPGLRFIRARLLSGLVGASGVGGRGRLPHGHGGRRTDVVIRWQGFRHCNHLRPPVIG